MSSMFETGPVFDSLTGLYFEKTKNITANDVEHYVNRLPMMVQNTLLKPFVLVATLL